MLMIKNLYKVLTATLFALCLCVGAAEGQVTYHNGVQHGVVKVKFTNSMTNSLKSMRVSTNQGLTTGISAFDQVSKEAKANAMHRLFPENPNPELEAKARKHGLHLWYRVMINEDQNPADVAKRYAALAEVSTAEVVREKSLSPYTVYEHSGVTAYSANASFDDPYLADQWHYDNTGQTGFDGGSDINLSAAWETTAGSAEVIVSIHDQGVDVNHADLVDNLWINEVELNGQPGIDDDNNGYIDDIHGYNFDDETGEIDPEFHGTHVAGTVAAVNNNGFGVAGVAGGTGNGDGARIMSLQMLNGGSIEETYIYAANNGAVISQNSWGYTNPGDYEQSVIDAINYFIEEAGDYEGSPMLGGVVIFAAGNSSWDAEWYPGYYEHTISVSSIGPNWQKAGYSNFGTWVDIAAPGGDTEYGAINGVLSTLPDNQFGYLDGTSMACPHVSGVAALILANRTSQLTAEVLWTKLLTGVVDIDGANPNYEGKLGSGHLDAYLAIQNDEGLAPDPIVDLAVQGISQEFANLSWTVPGDEDDGRPANFRVYYHTAAITGDNISNLSYDIIENDSTSGATIEHTVEGLFGLTTYHFAVISGDRWNNLSALSNVVTETTNDGPAIDVDELSKSITMDLDVSTSVVASKELTILNNAEGVLRWEYFTRHKTSAIAYAASGLHYPKVTNHKTARFGEVGIAASKVTPTNETSTAAYDQKSLSYHSYVTNIIGETDTSFTNSSATRYIVEDQDGFNLTHVQMYLKHDPEKGPVIVEVHRGGNVNKQNTIYAQEYSGYSADEHYAYITLDEQLYFGQGETFWIVFHIPSGNLYPLGMGPELVPTGSDNCYMSFDLGNSWAPLEEAIENDNFAWSTTAMSYNAYLGEYLSLNPAAGEIAGNSLQTVALSADATALINGSYQANIVLASNDVNNREMRLPVTLNVTGQQPELKSIETLDFGSVFLGTTRELSLVIENIGLGNYNDMSIEITNPQFQIAGWPPSRIAAKEEIALSITYNPTVAGNDNGILKLTSASSSRELKIILFGVGTEPAMISLSPETQLVDSLTIGDDLLAEITVENTGESALKYFVPGFDESGLSDNWTGEFHEYGYKVRTNYEDETIPLDYNFVDISETGTDITDYFRTEDNRYYPVTMGFDFPYYSETMETLYIAAKGFTTFSDEVNPINTPRLNGAPWSPQGYISVLGTYVDLSAGGNIYFQLAADRVIVQFDGVTDGYSGSITAQMVLHANGNIRFYYGESTFSSLQYVLNILIEDYAQTDGILLFDYYNVIDIYNGLALGFDYPGPDIITAISNAGGILLPGESSTLGISMSTDGLAEGLVNRYVNIISNDPAAAQKIAQIQLNIMAGGTPDLAISTDDIAFGEVFQGALKSHSFSIKNNGNAPDTIKTFNQSTSAFTVEGTTNAIVKPGLAENYKVSIPTADVAALADVFTIETSSGKSFAVNVSGSVLDPPAISTDLSTVEVSLAVGETSQQNISFENTGLADLEVVSSGNDWLTLSSSEEPVSSTYAYKLSNDGTKYQWLDIRKTGVQMPFPEDLFNVEEYYPKVKLPWAIEFYGELIDSLYIGQNGYILMEEPSAVSIFPDNIPTSLYDRVIAPYWTFGGFNTLFYPEEEVGIFVYTDDQKVVISWEYLIDNFGGLGDPISAQVIFYRNGTMKFQYKINGSRDAASNFTVIGVQNEDFADHLLLSNRSNLPHANGLAYVLTPADKYIVAPSGMLNAEIDVDARNIYAGYYADAMFIHTNVPGSEILQKPVNLTVTGEPMIASSQKEIDFGKIMATPEGTLSYSEEFAIQNDGVASLQLSGLITQSGSSDYLIEMYVYDSWFGSWFWSDISWVWSWPSIAPGDETKFRVTYSPTAAGALTDTIRVQSNLEVLEIPLKAEVSLPPAIKLHTTYVSSAVNGTTDTDNQTITFDNIDGQGELEFEVSIDYQRLSTTVTSLESMGDENGNAEALLRVSTMGKARSEDGNEYNRVLAYEDETNESTFLGYQGATAFITATRFNSGAEGFNLSHILSLYNAKEKPEGTVKYEVRAGGSNVVEARTLTSGHYDYAFSGEESEDAEWLTIPLDQPQVIYPNEDFYLVITYPFELFFPQATATNVQNAEGRYTYQFEGIWYDLQAPDGYPDFGWVVRAAEESFESGSWLSISEPTGRLAIGEARDMTLDLNAAYAHRGDQKATVVITTNDPKNVKMKVPVTFHVNEAPLFSEVPELVSVSESFEETVEIKVSDKESNSFDIALQEETLPVAFELENDLLKVTLSPDYEQAGNYMLTFVATDEFGASSEMTMDIEVLKTNRAPEVMLSEALHFDDTDAFYANQFADYFADPDGDDLSYEISVSDSSLAGVFVSNEEFVIETLAEGETSLLIAATDVWGARTEVEIPVVIARLVLNGTQRTETVIYPNPAVEYLHIMWKDGWKGSIDAQIVGIDGSLVKDHSLNTNGTSTIPVSDLNSGVYFLRAILAGESVWIRFIKE